jgi:carboxypeptidase D
MNDDEGSKELDFTLMRDDPQHWSSAYDYRVLDNIIKTQYHSNDDINTELAEMETKNYKVAQMEASENERTMVYNSLKVTAEVSFH